MGIRKALAGTLAAFLVAGAIFAPRLAAGDLVAKLPQVLNPFFITISAGRMYVVESDVSVRLFTIGPDGVSFVKSFGREGQGPGEYGFIYRVAVRPDRLDVLGVDKVGRFSFDGTFIEDVKVPVAFFKGGIYPVGRGFVIRDFTFDDKGRTDSVRLYDRDYRLVRELGTQTEKIPFEKLNLVSDTYSVRVSGDRIFTVRSGRRTTVTSYDAGGARLEEVVLPLEPVKITAAVREAIVKPMRENPDIAPRWKEYEQRLIFPDATPGLDYFDVVDGRFVTRTYRYKDYEAEFVTFDLKGRELSRTFLPFTGRLSNGILFCFVQGRYYYLHYDDGSDTWELRSEKAW